MVLPEILSVFCDFNQLKHLVFIIHIASTNQRQFYS